MHVHTDYFFRFSIFPINCHKVNCDVKGFPWDCWNQADEISVVSIFCFAFFSTYSFTQNSQLCNGELFSCCFWHNTDWHGCKIKASLNLMQASFHFHSAFSWLQFWALYKLFCFFFLYLSEKMSIQAIKQAISIKHF